jgi:biopolymer transport protein ExbD
MKRRDEPFLSGNLTAMIDVVFQLIIFFVCTSNMQDSAFNESIRLAMAPHGKVVENKDPREILIDIDANGQITIGRSIFPEDVLVAMLRKTVADQGKVPVIIRGDMETRHREIRRAMDAVKRAGLYNLKFAALKERGK